MVGQKSRLRYHRSKNNGTCQKISIAYYISSSPLTFDEKLIAARTNPNYIGEDVFYSDNRILICFSDHSILGFNDSECYVADTFGREDNGKKPSNSKRITKFIEVNYGG